MSEEKNKLTPEEKKEKALNIKKLDEDELEQISGGHKIQNKNNKN